MSRTNASKIRIAITLNDDTNDTFWTEKALSGELEYNDVFDLVMNFANQLAKCVKVKEDNKFDKLIVESMDEKGNIKTSIIGTYIDAHTINITSENSGEFTVDENGNISMKQPTQE